MELHVLQRETGMTVVLLDDEMRLIIPVCDFLRFLALRGRAPNTLKACGQDLKVYWEFLKREGLSFEAITPSGFVEFIDFLRSGNGQNTGNPGRSGRSVNRILSTVHTFYQYHADMREINNPILMHDRGWPQSGFREMLYHARSASPARRSAFKVRESTRPAHLVTEDEMRLFLSHLDKRRDTLLYQLLYLTGARIQEALDLLIEDVPFPDPAHTVGIFRQIRSKGKTRDLYVPMPLILELDDFILGERSRIPTEHSFLFVSEQPAWKGKKLTYSAAYDKLKSVQEKTGLDFNFHDLRHSFCSRLAQAGMDAAILRIIMGHEHISTTQRHTHLSERHIENSLGRYWEQSVWGGGTNGK